MTTQEYIRRLPAGLSLGNGPKDFTVERVTPENTYLRGAPEVTSGPIQGALRIIPTPLIVGIYNAISSGKIPYETLATNHTEKRLSSALYQCGVDHDRFILGYDASITRIIDRLMEPGSVQNSAMPYRPSSEAEKALLTKPFLILTGVSGTGKTQSALRLARELALSEGLDQDALLHVEPVGSGWTDQTPLWGFWDSLNGKYQATMALQFLLRAQNSPELPFFLVLDEMNLSHVERYFSGMLSALESGLAVPLHQQPVDDQQPIPQQAGWPENLFVVGTVNIDETTYMFSPKVLDRASVIEVRAAWDDVAQGGGLPALPTLEKGSAQAFVNLAHDLRSPDGTPPDEPVWQEVLSRLKAVFEALQEHGLEFGYRTIAEARRYTAVAGLAGVTDGALVADQIILQRVLPKLNGSRTKLGPLLKRLGDVFAAGGHPESGRKVQSMQKALERDQFVSFIQ